MEIVRTSVDLNEFLEDYDCASYSLSGFCCNNSSGKCCKGC